MSYPSKPETHMDEVRHKHKNVTRRQAGGSSTHRQTRAMLSKCYSTTPYREIIMQKNKNVVHPQHILRNLTKEEIPHNRGGLSQQEMSMRWIQI